MARQYEILKFEILTTILLSNSITIIVSHRSQGRQYIELTDCPLLIWITHKVQTSSV